MLLQTAPSPTCRPVPVCWNGKRKERKKRWEGVHAKPPSAPASPGAASCGGKSVAPNICRAVACLSFPFLLCRPLSFHPSSCTGLKIRPERTRSAPRQPFVTSGRSRVWGWDPLVSRGPCARPRASPGHRAGRASLWHFPVSPPPLPQVAMNKSLFYKREAAAFFLPSPFFFWRSIHPSPREPFGTCPNAGSPVEAPGAQQLIHRAPQILFRGRFSARAASNQLIHCSFCAGVKWLSVCEAHKRPLLHEKLYLHCNHQRTV